MQHFLNLEPKFLLEEITQHPKQSTSALKVQAKHMDEKCQHNRNPSSCWTCHPKMAPICEICRGQGLRRFKHKQFSHVCPQPKQDRANVAFTAHNVFNNTFSWILDSGATQHIVMVNAS